MTHEDPYDLAGWRIHALCSAVETCESPDQIDSNLVMFPERYNTETQYKVEQNE